MSAITTHVLDTAAGLPAAGLSVRLERLDGERWLTIARATTDADGRARELFEGTAPAGQYRLCFATAEYFARRGTKALYPEVVVRFELEDATPKLHLPLLLGPYSYSTYRGS
jgi:5-hydroxyisourate hydrolase